MQIVKAKLESIRQKQRQKSNKSAKFTLNNNLIKYSNLHVYAAYIAF